MRRPALCLILALPACDLWISDGDFSDFEKGMCEASFSAQDADGDGYLPDTATLPERCPLTFDELLVQQGLALGDCDDADGGIHPGVDDPCADDVDQDCDGVDPPLETWYSDQDTDGFGAPATMVEVCGAPEGAVQNGDDCDDTDALVNPYGVETTCADEVDSDCDGVTDCAVYDTVDISRSAWSTYGVRAEIEADLSGGTFAVGEDLNGDGVRDASIAVAEGAFTLIWNGDSFETSAVPDDRDTLSEGALAMLPDPLHSGDIALALGAPGDGEEGNGAVVFASLRTGTVRLSAGAKEGQVGYRIGDGGDGIAVGVHTSDPVGMWSAIIVDDNAVPETDSGLDSVIDAQVSLGQGTSTSLANLSMVPRSGGDDLLAAWTPGLDPVRASWFQAPLSDDSEPRVTVTHSDRSADFGETMALLDIDGTGELDLVIGAPGAARVTIVTDPAPGELASEDADYGIDGMGNYGTSLANIGDFDGDGIDDLVIGSSEADHIDLILGGTALFKTYATVKGAVSSDLGDAVAGLDMDDDGFSDLLVSAPADSAVYLLWGGP